MPTKNAEVFIYQGIDRLDNQKGYEIENCIPCCYVCNKAKGNRNQKEFIEHCKVISQRFD